MNFLVSIPVWGDWYADVCRRALIPSLRMQRPVDGHVRYLVHTDRQMEAEFDGLDVEFRSVPHHIFAHEAMSCCHRDALATADEGEAVILLVADQVMSPGTLSFCSLALEKSGAVFCVAPRVLSDLRETPDTELLRWGWSRRHPWTEESTLGRGRARYHSVVYFERNDSVVAHCFHPHPVAVLRDDRVSFQGTLDCGLIDMFDEDEIRVADNRQFSVIEISREDKTIPSMGSSVFEVSDVIRWAGAATSSAQRSFFARRVVLCGSGDDCGDEEFVAEVLEALR